MVEANRDPTDKPHTLHDATKDLAAFMFPDLTPEQLEAIANEVDASRSDASRRPTGQEATDMVDRQLDTILGYERPS